MNPYCTTRTIGDSNRQRQLGAAALLLLGAVGCATTTLAGWPLYQTLVVLGVAATLAWLADGTSQRFMGPGLAALAVGGGITAYRALGMDAMGGEHGVVYPALGAALLLASLFDPLGMRGAGTFLLIVGVVALIDTPGSPAGRSWRSLPCGAPWSSSASRRAGAPTRSSRLPPPSAPPGAKPAARYAPAPVASTAPEKLSALHAGTLPTAHRTPAGRTPAPTGRWPRRAQPFPSSLGSPSLSRCRSGPPGKERKGGVGRVSPGGRSPGAWCSR